MRVLLLQVVAEGMAAGVGPRLRRRVQSRAACCTPWHQIFCQKICRESKVYHTKLRPCLNQNSSEPLKPRSPHLSGSPHLKMAVGRVCDRLRPSALEAMWRRLPADAPIREAATAVSLSA